jgi:lysozyme family protein
MANFIKALKKTLSYEGGYANVAGDGGGETYRGIARKYHPNWPGWRIVDQKKRKHNEIIPELEDEVASFYKTHYWDTIRLDEVCNDAIAGFVFDVYVNSGRSGIKMIQRAVGVQDDGIVGPKTIQAINQTDLATLKKQREAFYRAIVANNPSQAKFLKGWLARNSSF